MRTIVFVLALAASTRASAQEGPPGQTELRVGIALTVAGAALTATSLALAASTGPRWPSDQRFSFEVAVGATGMASLGAGITYWILGARRSSELTPLVALQRGGASAGIALTSAW
jgi:hypothetical protein